MKRRSAKSVSAAVTAAFALAVATAGCDRGGDEPAEDRENESEAAEKPTEAIEDGEATAHAEQAPKNHPDHDHPDHDHGDDEDLDLTDDLEPGTAGHYGAEFSDPDAEPMALAAALEQCVGTGDTCKVRGEVSTVCESRGCWMELEAPAEADRILRVRMLDYGFFVPRNTQGAEAIVEGTIEETEVSEERALHYAEKGSGDADEIDGAQPEYRIVASGVELQLPEG